MAQLMAEERAETARPQTEDAPLRIDRFGRHPRAFALWLLRVFSRRR